MFRLSFKTANDAFVKDAGRECARILREIADTLERRGAPSNGIAFDANGYGVGNWTCQP